MRVAVIGAGYAGLAAAVELAAKGIPVTVFEAARQLGGRARRVDYRGMALDNGQHILLGAYRETLRLMRMTGADPAVLLLRLPLQLVIPGRFSLQAAPLPAPLHLVLALLTAHGLTWGERLSAARFMSVMRRRNFRLNDDIDAGKMLTMHGQIGNLRRYLWEPLCIGALNTPLETASAQVFLNVLRDSLAGSREDSDMLLPLANLTHLFPEHAAAFIESHGGKIVHSQPVLAVKAEAAGFSLEMQSGSEKFDQVISAVPPQRLAALTANLPELAEARAQVARFSYQPIYSVFLQYPAATRLSRPMIGLYGGVTQWVLDRGQLNHENGLLCAVISSEGPHQTLDHDDLAQRVHDELRVLLPDLPQPLWHKVIAEKRATFACSPGMERPDQVTPLPNFFLAGDYTAGDYPATLESAVRSGVKCAKLIQESA
ncbi:squalene-associated FAD-dependent desaturase [Sulfuricella denitrificans skB26]|uniref:Squalene-associated FAD-dependent desaturase n=1 Tax=Sulfuricella denitrificans (strain DSM 22764 / NBRC 105220 / skB26) TaxID=1163617 RepID=S6AAB9_SULDS|nr:hydroxysqualene dehydroxylase HpnE [Sulfuricella denitrificans]BAN35590.1 squalene-associated FAD-dependent desaturase [Sulfuricella denitrificans skB26]